MVCINLESKKVALETNSDELTDDICTIEFANITIRVGWLVDDSAFLCVVLRNHDWEHPAERMVTKDPVHAIGWVGAMTLRYNIAKARHG